MYRLRACGQGFVYRGMWKMQGFNFQLLTDLKAVNVIISQHLVRLQHCRRADYILVFDTLFKFYPRPGAFLIVYAYPHDVPACPRPAIEGGQANIEGMHPCASEVIFEYIFAP